MMRVVVLDRDLHREVGRDGLHLRLESLRNAVQEVLRVALPGVKQRLRALPVRGDRESERDLPARDLELQGIVREHPLGGPEGPLYRKVPTVERHLDPLGDRKHHVIAERIVSRHTRGASLRS